MTVPRRDLLTVGFLTVAGAGWMRFGCTERVVDGPAVSLETRARAVSTSFPENVRFVRTEGYARSGDGGASLNRRVDAEPRHAGKFRSADGAWWEIADEVLNLRQFGVKLDGAADDREALMAAMTAADALHRPLVWPGGTIRITAPIVLTLRQVRWRAEGCTVQCDFDQDEYYGLQVVVGVGVAHIVEGTGLLIDAGGRVHRALEFQQPLGDQTATFRGVGLGASNVEMRVGAGFGSAGITFSGGFGLLHLVEPRVEGVMMRRGAGVLGLNGVTGLLVVYGSAVPGAYALRAVIERPVIDRVYSEDPAWRYDMDGIGFFAHPGIDDSKGLSSVEILSPRIAGCWGRLIKTQAGRTTVRDADCLINAGPVEGIANVAIDIQTGSGSVHGGDILVDGVAVKTGLVRFSVVPAAGPMNSTWEETVVRVSGAGRLRYALVNDPDAPGEPTNTAVRNIVVKGEIDAFAYVRTNGFEKDAVQLDGVEGAFRSELVRVEAKSGGTGPYRARVRMENCRNVGDLVPMVRDNITGQVADARVAVGTRMAGFVASLP